MPPASARSLVFSEVPGSKATYHFAYDIPRNQVGEAHTWLARRTSPLSRNGNEVFQFESWNAEAMYFVDPAGNIGEFIARKSVANDSSKPFGPESLLAVSELGIPVPDVSIAVAVLRSSIGWKSYREPAPDFAAVGRESGLLILAREGRPWFPTDAIAARAFTAEIEVESSENFELQLNRTLIRRWD